MPLMRDISNWERQPHFHTTGSRAKFIVVSPHKEETYYFKSSYQRESVHYKYEFWSEIIATKIGNMFGFNVITYDLAYSVNNEEKQIGCISKSIIDDTKEDLHEGYKFIVAIDKKFASDYKKGHSFQRIIKALKKSGLEESIKDVIGMIVFDAIIGNTDRHSENWSVRVKAKALHDMLTSVEKRPFLKRVGLTFQIIWVTGGEFLGLSSVLNSIRRRFYEFAPIYDSGSSLGRELAERKIQICIEDKNALRAYANRGKPEIRWKKERITHVELIQNIRKKYRDEVDYFLDQIKEVYKKEQIRELIKNIDKKIPEQFAEEYKIPLERKEFIIRYICLRIEDLLKINKNEI